MLAEEWPLFGLTVETPRLRLRLPREEEIAQVASCAAGGVHLPQERPFLTPWTETSGRGRARFVLQEHWKELGSWQPEDWRLGLGVFLAGDPLGMVTLSARDFAVVREVTTSSWLGLEYHGKGIGTEARLGALALAFEHLGAAAARTEVFPDNHASQGVSRKLGYVHDGISRDRRGSEVLVSDRLRLTRSGWQAHAQSRPVVQVTGLDSCQAMFVGDVGSEREPARPSTE